MMFVCYTVALALLGFAYQWPDLFMLVTLFLVAKSLLWRAR